MIVAILIVIVLALLNYQPGTFLSGWDTIHSEFNVWLDLQRTIFGVWQEYRGVGVLDGMGHTADLVRQLILLPVSLLLPTATIRFLSQFLWLGIGAAGMGWWFEKQIVNKAPALRKYLVSSIVSTVYLLNFGTVTNFHLPLESFSIFYAFLPWSLWAFFEVLARPNRKKWLQFMGANLLLTPAFYIPTIFIVYGLLLALTGGVYLAINRSWLNVKKLILAALLILTLNTFWLLPFGYFVLTGSHTPREAQINQMSTQEVYLQNKHRGSWQDFVLMRGYYYDLKESQANIMQPWIDHYQDPKVMWVAYAFAGLVGVGILLGGKKSAYLAPALVLTAVALLSNESIIAPIHDLFANSSPFLAQVFRSPYTKFVGPLILLYAFYIGLAVNSIMVGLEKIKLKYVSILLLVIVAAASFWLVQPVFTGHLFASSVKVDIPDEYFELFSFFESQPADSRIAVLPQHSYWGWQTYDWGYQGSGFIWWGLPQATMDRAFDVWNRHNENFYWQLNRAAAAGDQPQFDSIMQKYRVEWLVVDESLKHFESSQNEIGFTAVEALVDSAIYQKQASFGKLTVYQNSAVAAGYVRSPAAITTIGNTQNWNDWDQVYQSHGDYLLIPEQSELQWQYTYPFASLFTNKTAINSDISISVHDGGFILSTNLPRNVAGSQLILDQVKDDFQFYDQGQYIRLGVLLDDSLTTYVSALDLTASQITLDQAETLSVVIPRLNTELRNNSIDQQLFQESNSSNCNVNNGGAAHQQVVDKSSAKSLLLTTTNNFDCKGIVLDDIVQTDGYLVTTTSQNLQGLPLLFNWVDLTSGQVLNTVKLNQTAGSDTATFILPPLGSDQNLYQLSYTNHSYQDFVTKNEITSLTVQKIPYQYLKNIRLEQENHMAINQLEISQSKRLSPWLYSLTYSQTDHGNSSAYGALVLDQAYDAGWMVVPANPFGRWPKVIHHTTLNNWSNAWIVETNNQEPTAIYILFAPQLLAVTGYLLVPVVMIASVLVGRNYAKTN